MKQLFFLQVLRYRANLQDVNISPHLKQVIFKDPRWILLAKQIEM